MCWAWILQVTIQVYTSRGYDEIISIHRENEKIIRRNKRAKNSIDRRKDKIRRYCKTTASRQRNTSNQTEVNNRVCWSAENFYKQIFPLI